MRPAIEPQDDPPIEEMQARSVRYLGRRERRCGRSPLLRPAQGHRTSDEGVAGVLRAASKRRADLGVSDLMDQCGGGYVRLAVGRSPLCDG
jgi:hypothetical protein